MKRLRPVFRIAPDGSFTFSVKDLSQFRLILGRDVLRKLLACTIQVDRLLSLQCFMVASTRYFLQGSVGERRQFLTMLTFAAGTLRELALALPKLRGALMRKGFLEPGEWPPELAKIEEKWENTRSRVDLRDKVAFHLDLDRLDLALDDAEKAKRKIYLEGDSEESEDSWCRLGADVQIGMFGVSEQVTAEVIGDIFEGIDTVSASLDSLTLVLIGRAGMTIEGRDLKGPYAKRFNRAPGTIKLTDVKQ